MARVRQREYHGDSESHRARGFVRSGWATAMITALALLSFGLLWRAHQRAQFHQFRTSVIPQTTSVPMPGGQEAMLLSRVALVNDAEPEFTSATVLPGIGMQLLQVTVAVPDGPTQDLLASVPLSDAARLPAESVNKALFHVRVSTHHLQENNLAGDVAGFTPAAETENQTLVDGGQATGTFHGAMQAGVSTTVEVTLSGRQIDLVARCTSSAEENRYVAFEWAPHFAAPFGDLGRLALLVPSRALPGMGSSSGAESTLTPFTQGEGQAIGNRPVDARFGNLVHDSLNDGTSVRLQNGDLYYIRIVGLGDSLRSVHVQSEPSSRSLLLALSSFDSAAEAERRDQTLRPHQTIQWHLRMEVLPVKLAQPPENTR